MSSTGNDLTILPSSGNEALPDFDLDHDFYLEFWFKCLISLILLLTLELVIFVSASMSFRLSIVKEFLYNFFLWLLITAPFSAYCFTLISVIAPRLQTGKLVKAALAHWVTYVFMVMCFVALTVFDVVGVPYVAVAINGLFGVWLGQPEIIMIGLLVLYVLGSFIVAASYYFK